MEFSKSSILLVTLRCSCSPSSSSSRWGTHTSMYTSSPDMFTSSSPFNFPFASSVWETAKGEMQPLWHRLKNLQDVKKREERKWSTLSWMVNKKDLHSTANALLFSRIPWKEDVKVVTNRQSSRWTFDQEKRDWRSIPKNWVDTFSDTLELSFFLFISVMEVEVLLATHIHRSNDAHGWLCRLKHTHSLPKEVTRHHERLHGNQRESLMMTLKGNTEQSSGMGVWIADLSRKEREETIRGEGLFLPKGSW